MPVTRYDARRIDKIAGGGQARILALVPVVFGFGCGCDMQTVWACGFVLTTGIFGHGTRDVDYRAKVASLARHRWATPDNNAVDAP